MINSYHCTRIVEFAQMIWSRRDRHQLTIGKKLITIFNNLYINSLFSKIFVKNLTCCARHIKSILNLSKNYKNHCYLYSVDDCSYLTCFTTLRPNRYEIFAEFSIQFSTAVSGEDHKRSQRRPEITMNEKSKYSNNSLP